MAVWPAVTVAEVAPTLGGSMAKFVAAPTRGTDCGVFAVLSASVKVALRVPTAVGMNVTLTVQVAAGAIGLLHVSCSRKSVGFAPENDKDAITSAPVPEFVMVSATGGLGVPTSWFVKFKLEDDMETMAWVAVPARVTEWGLPAALSATEIEADLFPAASGLKITVI